MKKPNVFSIAVAAFLAVFFIVIVMLILMSVIDADVHKAFAAVTTFSCINMAILAAVIGMGKTVSDAIGVGSYASVCIATVLYTVGRFTFLGFNYTTEEVFRYVIIELIIMFVYFLIALPITAVGVRRKKEIPADSVTTDDKGVKYHNI